MIEISNKLNLHEFNFKFIGNFVKIENIYKFAVHLNI